ncbi:hypothetical protein LSAT2_026299 [Lamellibrachia satsuma]|nr:hypothetical protein LSAT2_026299 [Lamellibrachia satsuma]
MLAVPISMVVIGSIYLGQCPQKHYIPIYLIVTGAFGILKILLNIGQCVKAPVDEEGDDENVTRLNQYGDVLSSVLVSCFIAGNVLIYCIYNDFDSLDATSPKYCQPTLYWFAFWMTNAANILILSLCCCCSCRARPPNVALINARSVRNMTLTINEDIIEHEWDVLAITETWPKKTGDEAIIAELTPPGYTFQHVARVSGRGG